MKIELTLKVSPCSEECYVAIDHCPRSLVEVCSSDAAAGAKHTLLLTLLENHEGRTVEMVSQHHLDPCSEECCHQSSRSNPSLNLTGRIAVERPFGTCSWHVPS